MVRLLIVMGSLLVLQSCGSNKSIDPNSVEGKIAASIKTTCRGSRVCTIRIRDVTKFDWDKMYVFKYTATNDEIQKVVGIPLPHYNDFERKIIFVSGDKVVYSEADPTDVERPI